ncbi:MAG: DUF262 domain-containing protein [Paraclostridium bifermentans]|uniref:DUF262 domain-containing protein n=1 Tax=Paraclostridium bifermentans TaxID=1490 RepID=UPI001D7DBD0C|nr:DUF262 domain-containing protein [Paraclostridium bifermentans]MBS6508640.1 DUF262 domain-containing protein [Paraclostridium bifermentans]
MFMFFDEFNEDDIENDDKNINIEDLLNTKISYKTKVMDIESVLNALKRGDYILPKYQRKYVWEKAQASNLILSLIKNIPIPPLYLYYDNNTKKYVVLDGQQRITTVFMYYNDIFYKSRNGREKIDFRDVSRMLDEVEYLIDRKGFDQKDLTKEEIKRIDGKINSIYKEIESKYNISKTTFNLELGEYQKDITFSNFDEKAKRILRRKDLEVVFVECEDKKSDKAYSEIFKLLNSAGKELSSQEIRNGVYYNNILYDKIYELNKSNTVWRKIYGAESLICKDFEYLLRFLALDYYSKYNERMNKFEIEFNKAFSYSNIIDSYSEKFNRGLHEDDSDKIEEAKRAVEKLDLFFDRFNDIDKNTKMTGKNLLILESMFLAFSKLNLLYTNIKISYFEWVDQLKNDEKVKLYIAQSTSSKGNVQSRVNEIILLMQGMFEYECKRYN